MLNVSKSNATVWKVENKGKYCSGRVSSSKKDRRTGNYVNSNWNVRFIGHSFEPAKALKEKDKITITNGFIENIWDKENNRNWLTLVVFDFEYSEQAKQANASNSASSSGDYVEVETEPELPF